MSKVPPIGHKDGVEQEGVEGIQMPLNPSLPYPIEQIAPPSGHPIFMTGPPLSEGPLPAIFYFCSTGLETLGTDPYNQPVNFLRPYPIRVFSMSLPLHEEAPDRRKAVSLWAKELHKGHDPLTPFLTAVCTNIDYLVEQQLILSKHLAVAGLSRGGWIATHIAARCTHVSSVTAFAPLIDLMSLSDFHHIPLTPEIEAMALTAILPRIVGIPLRYYIGNHDTRVGTDICIRFIQALTHESQRMKLRSIPVELIISPSIGHQGHGTPPHIFRSGAYWLAANLGILSQDEGYYP